MKNGMKMRVLASFMDSGGHFTEDVYKQCARRASRRLWAIKGEGGDKPLCRPMKRSGTDNSVRFLIGVDAGKESIMYASSVEEPGPRYMHFPLDEKCGYSEQYFKGLMSEQMVFHRKGGVQVIAWDKIYERNEPLDCRNYARAAYKYFNWHFDDLENLIENNGEVPEKIETKEQAQRKKRKTVISGGIKI